MWSWFFSPFLIIIIIVYPLTARVVGAPQMISQPISSIFPCSPLPFGTWRTPGLSISWCCLPTSSSVCLVFFPLSLCLARWFWPDLKNGRHDHTTAVCISFYNGQEIFMWSDCLLDLGTDFLVGNMVFVLRCVVSCASTSFPWLVFSTPWNEVFSLKPCKVIWYHNDTLSFCQCSA